MKILALEFSSAVRSAAVLVDGKVGADVRLVAGQGDDLFGLVARALEVSGIEREAIEMVAVGIGPGSYTGVRSAIAIARGWATGRGCALCGVSSTKCVAARAAQAGPRPPIAVGVFAHRDSFYVASYPELPVTLATPEVIQLLPAEKARGFLAESTACFGPGLSAWMPNAIDLDPDAAALGRLVSEGGPGLGGGGMEPIYLRENEFLKIHQHQQPKPIPAERAGG
jgi:tRNA threonylcarbamoyladenosine biosynthesis protein TsaB